MLKKFVIQDKVDNDVRVDPRVRRTRHLLQKAFDELLEEKGFPNITVNDIVERADVNRATFYLHFEDKHALLRYNLRESFTRMLEERLQDEHTFSIDNLYLFTVTVCEFVSKFYGRCHPDTDKDEKIIILAQLQHHVYEWLLRWFISSGHSQSSVENTAAALSWLVFGAAIQAQISETKQQPAQIAQQMLALVTPGLHLALEPLSERQSTIQAV